MKFETGVFFCAVACLSCTLIVCTIQSKPSVALPDVIFSDSTTAVISDETGTPACWRDADGVIHFRSGVTRADCMASALKTRIEPPREWPVPLTVCTIPGEYTECPKAGILEHN